MSAPNGLMIHQPNLPKTYEAAIREGKDLRDPIDFDAAKVDGHRMYNGWYQGLNERCGGVVFLERVSYVVPGLLRRVSPSIWVAVLNLIWSYRVMYPFRLLEHVILNIHVLLVLLRNDLEFVFFSYAEISRPIEWYCRKRGIELVCFYGMHPDSRIDLYRDRVAAFDHVISGYDLAELWPEILDKHSVICQSPSDASRYTRNRDVETDIDICVIGGFDQDMFRTRTELTAALLDRFGDNLDIAVYGYARDLSGTEIDSRVEQLHGEAFYRTLARCKLYVNVPNDYHIEMDETRPQGIMEPPAAGTFQLAYDTERTRQIWEVGEEIDVFESTNDLFDKIEYYLEHPKERERMAQNAHERFLTEYNAEQEIQRVFEEIGICTPT